MIAALLRAGFLAVALAGGPVLAQTVAVSVPPSADGLSLTIHDGGIALVRDRRPVELQAGRNTIAFEEVSPAIVAESATLRGGEGLRLVQQSFDRDLLTAQTLLQKAPGREVWVQRINPASGAIERRRGTVLAVDGPVVVRIDGLVETVDPAAIVFDEIPAGLRRKPALVAEIEARTAGRQQLELAYLTHGLSWRADYTVELKPGEPRLALDAMATVSNDSGTVFDNARLALAAGDLNLVPPPAPPPRPLAAREMKAMAAPERMVADTGLSPQAMAAAHLYRLDRPVDLGEHQTKQVSLLHRPAVLVQKEYVAEPLMQVFHQRLPDPQESNAALEVVVRNDEASGLGVPLPAGIVRIYQRDAQGELQLQGEDRIGHMAEGAKLRLRVGRDFDLPVRRVQTAFQRVAENVTETAYEVTVRNAKPEAVTVLVKDSLAGDWQILEETVPHRRDSAQTAVWPLPVPAKGEAVLRYRVRVKGY